MGGRVDIETRDIWFDIHRGLYRLGGEAVGIVGDIFNHGIMQRPGYVFSSVTMIFDQKIDAYMLLYLPRKKKRRRTSSRGISHATYRVHHASSHTR